MDFWFQQVLPLLKTSLFQLLSGVECRTGRRVHLYQNGYPNWGPFTSPFHGTNLPRHWRHSD